MGITRSSTGINVTANDLKFIDRKKDEKIIALAGNPNVGKSTVFNALTGMNQHTGNWPGKTVANAQGSFSYKDKKFTLVDVPGTYSLMANSLEEEVARDFICFGKSDLILVVADATCLERNLNLILQILEITKNVVICVNLLDEAKKKKINIDLDELSLQLGVPVVGTTARSKKGLDNLLEEIYKVSSNLKKTFSVKLLYDDIIEQAINIINPEVEKIVRNKINSRWVSLKLLETDEKLFRGINDFLGENLTDNPEIYKSRQEAINLLKQNNINDETLRDAIVKRIMDKSEEIYNMCVCLENPCYNSTDRKIDKLLTSKTVGIPIMLLMLGVIFWITIAGANYPSEIIGNFLFSIQDKITNFLTSINAPTWVNGMFVLGVYRTLAWVISVMLPPMAIFFPLFTILEDSGYLPRVAFNMDSFFKKAGAHGKQSLTMCMGFGCNACGVIGCRIIESPRERLIAILTNNFVPCNGRFPTLITIITIFFAGSVATQYQSLFSTFILLFVIIGSVLATLLVSKILSNTILKGMPSSFILELPPYRTPQFGKVIVRSIFDRTLFVLGRAVAVAAPAGLIIWILSNITISDVSILNHCANFLDPFAKLLGLDGVILLAFILGFPANEIVMPIIIMSYLCTGSLMEFDNIWELHTLLVNNGWTWVTAVCVMIFSLMHFPCGTTCLTIKKETGSLKWTLISIFLPTCIGMILCFFVSSISKLICF